MGTEDDGMSEVGLADLMIQTSVWRSMIEDALGLEPDVVNHDLAWAWEAIRIAREVGNGVSVVEAKCLAYNQNPYK